MAAPWADRSALRLIAHAIMDTDVKPGMRLHRIKAVLRTAGVNVDGSLSKFPRRLHVSWSEAVSGPAYLTVDESKDANEIPDGQPVGIYELVGVRKKKVIHQLR
jgi:hypothetical protein